MFDPKKYDNTDNPNVKDRVGTYIEKRDAIIKYLLNMKPLILKECESLDKKVEENPDSDMARAFNKKLDGWSRILNGADILNKMYLGNE